MKNKTSIFRRKISDPAFRGGFTLTEVLLAIMIVGLIGVALASLTRAAARESGAGRSKIMLRNNLSMFMRTLRKDMAQATYVKTIAGTLSLNDSAPVTLLKVAQNVDNNEQAVSSSLTPKWITYCFVRGSDNSRINPEGAYRDGAIYRLEREREGSFWECKNEDINQGGDMVLNNVKYIPSGADGTNYPVPLFALNPFSRDHTKSLLDVRLITELNSTPVINDVVEETFSMPMGY